MISSFGFGTLLSSLAFTVIGEQIKKSWLLIYCTLILMVSFLLISLIDNAYVITIILFFVGMSVGFMGPLDETILQINAPDKIRGRVFLLYSFLRFVLVPPTIIIVGVLLDITSVWYTFGFMGIFLGFSLIWLLLNRKVFDSL